VSVSSEILPEIREFERTSTTTLNAYLQPVVGDYLEQLEKGLAESGFSGRFLVVQSNGGVMTVERARSVPVRTALSGPAAGVIAASRIAVAAGHPNVLTGDMGGTSFDVAVVVDGRSVQAAQTTIDFGLVVRTPMIEMSTIGAGGGSIAWVDRGGLLQIGPESAGGVPGPVSYGMGNDRPTVTDANVVLGRINAERPIGGRAALDVEAARRAIDEHVGGPLGLSIEDAAEAIIAVAETRMSGALHIVSIERGHDPSKFWMVPFGGAGALHTCAFVRDLGLAGALVPRLPGVISALGCVLADMRYDSVRTWQSPLVELDLEAVRESMRASIDESRRSIESSGVVFDGIDVEMALDMSYVGQTHAVAVPLPIHDPNDLEMPVIGAAFESAYRAQFGRLLNGVAVRVLGVRTSVIGRRPEFDLARLARGATNVDDARSGRRPVYVGGQWREADVWNRLLLPIGATVTGPCILEQPDATTLVEPGFRATVDRLGNLEVVRDR
jgi:N-methylhydantoinase A